MYQGFVQERRVAMGSIELFDDFLEYLSKANGWETTATDSGSIAAADVEGGQAVLTPSDGSVVNNDETYLHTLKVFLFRDDGYIYAAARIKTTKVAASINTHNWLFGFSSAAVADTIQDDGAGPPANYYGAVFFKADGAAARFFEASAGTAQTTSAALDDMADDTYYTYEIIGVGAGGNKMRLWFLIDGVPQGTDDQKKHGVELDITSAVVMRAIIGIKLGASTDNDLLKVDWAYARQQRA